MRTYLHINQASQRLKNPTGAEFDTLKWKDRFGVQTEKQHQGSVSFTVQETHRFSVQMSAESHESVRKLVENRWHARQPTQLIRKPWPIVNKKGGLLCFSFTTCATSLQNIRIQGPYLSDRLARLLRRSWSWRPDAEISPPKATCLVSKDGGRRISASWSFISFLRILRKPLRNHEKSIAWTYSFRILRYLPHAVLGSLRKQEDLAREVKSVVVPPWCRRKWVAQRFFDLTRGTSQVVVDS